MEAHNIKYFITEKTHQHSCCKTTYYDGKGDQSDYYWVYFEDGSSVLMHSCRNDKYAFYSKSRYETKKGKQRNIFTKDFDVKSAITLLNELEKKCGYTQTNKGQVVIINPVGLRTQIQI